MLATASTTSPITTQSVQPSTWLLELVKWGLANPSWLVGAGVFFGIAAYFLVPIWFDKKMTARFNKDLETHKSSLTKQTNDQLELTKHRLLLVSSQKSIVYERQRESFTNCIGAMNTVLASFDTEPDYGYTELGSKPYKEFDTAIEKESLYLDTDASRAFAFMLSKLGGAVHWAWHEPNEAPSGKKVGHCHAYASLVRKQLIRHFQQLSGINIGETNALTSIHYLAACSLISDLHIGEGEHAFPTKTTLRMNLERPPEELADHAHANHTMLISELEKFIFVLDNDDENESRSIFYDYLSEARWFLKRLQMPDIKASPIDQGN